MRAGHRTCFLTSTVALAALSAIALAGIGTAGAVSPDAAPARAGAPSNLTPADAPIADDRLLVTVDPGTSTDQARAIADAAGARLESRAGDTLILDPTAAEPVNPTEINALPGVQVVEPNGTIQASGAPNDPLFPDQYGLNNTQPGGIRAEQGWNGTLGSRDVVVGVLDSGIDLSHPDLVANLWTNRTGINGCAYGTHGWNVFTRDCNPVDDVGHGTVVAGIVGAVGNNGVGVSGVAQQVSLMPIKMLARNAAGNASGTEADALEGIAFALAAKDAGVNIRVLQASWGTTASSVAISSAIAAANSRGILFVTSAGNGDQLGQPLDLDAPGNNLYPCEDASPNVVCVAASTEAGGLWSASNFGLNAVDIAAPGFRVLSTVPRGLCTPGSDYCLFDGTSMAAPMVSGAAVDIIAAEPSISVVDLKARILGAAAPLGSLTGKVATGGRLDVCKALPNCDGRPAVPPTKPTSVRASTGDGSATIRWRAPDSNGNSFIVTGYEVQGPAGITSLDWTGNHLTISGLSNNQNAVLRVRSFGTGGNGPWVKKTVRPHVGGYEVNRFGAVQTVGIGGQSPTAATGAPTFPFDLARGVAIVPEGTGGYVVDAYGGMHRFTIGAGSPMPPAVTGGPYWPGWDIVRGVAVSPKGGGYVLDGFGGLHPFGFGVNAPPTAARDSSYWAGFDIARGVTFNAGGTGGYVADGYGGIHRFRIGGAALPPAASGGPYWPGWNIVRGITLVPGSGGGWILDGFGGLHRFAAGGSLPAPATGSPYSPGQDVARGVSV